MQDNEAMRERKVRKPSIDHVKDVNQMRCGREEIMKEVAKTIFIIVWIFVLSCANHLQRAKILSQEGRAKKAILEYQKALEKSEQKGEIYKALGDLCLKEDANRAIEYYRYALEYLSDDPTIYAKIGDLFLRVGEEEKALYYYEKCLELHPDYELKERVGRSVTVLCFNQTEKSDNLEAYKKFLARFPNSEFTSRAKSRMEELAYQKAQLENTLYAYENFIQEYPENRFISEAKKGIEELTVKEEFEKAEQSGSVEDYQEFVSTYPTSIYSDLIRERIVEIERKREILEKAVKKVLPTECKTEVELVTPKEGSKVDIRAHLLEGLSPDDESPYVRGDYSTHQLLENLVKKRVVKIYKSVFTSLESDIPSEVVVECRHGVRYYYGFVLPIGGGGEDKPTTIYKTVITKENASRIPNWNKASKKEIEEIWTVEENLIPSLNFQTIFQRSR
jgi:tetratricopeptide (TPR) repeat protein